MKILLVSSTLSKGGAQRAAAELSRYLDRNHEVVHVVYSDDISYPYGGRIVNLNLPYNIDNSKWEKVYRLFHRSRLLRKVLKKEKPDFVISFSDTFNIFSMINKVTGFPAKFITSTQLPSSIAYQGINKFIYGSLITFLFNRADTVLAISQGIADDLVENFRVKRSKIKIIHNPVDNAIVKQKASEDLVDDRLSKNKLKVINVGRLTAQKNHFLLLDAFKLVLEQVEAQLVILGAGDLEKEVKNHASALGINDDVYFAGFVDNPFKYCKDADLFVLSSDYEGFGNVIVEAMASNCPVISTDCDFGPNEIIVEGKSGNLVPTKNPEALAKAIIDLLKDESKRKVYQEEGIKRAKDFDLDNIGRQYEELMESLME